MKIGDANSVIDYRITEQRGAILRGGFRGGSPEALKDAAGVGEGQQINLHGRGPRGCQA